MERRRWHGACAEDADCGDGSCPSAALFATPLTAADRKARSPFQQRPDRIRPATPIGRCIRSGDRIRVASVRPRAYRMRARVCTGDAVHVQRPCDMRDQVQF